MYADPVGVNGAEMRSTGLVGRARMLQRAFDQLGMHIVDAVETPDRVVIAFLIAGATSARFTHPWGPWRRPSARSRCARLTY